MSAEALTQRARREVAARILATARAPAADRVSRAREALGDDGLGPVGRIVAAHDEPTSDDAVVGYWRGMLGATDDPRPYLLRPRRGPDEAVRIAALWALGEPAALRSQPLPACRASDRPWPTP